MRDPVDGLRSLICQRGRSERLRAITLLFLSESRDVIHTSKHYSHGNVNLLFYRC